MYGSGRSRPLDYERAEVIKAEKKNTREAEEKTLLSEWISLLKKCLTGPTLLEMSGLGGDLNRSMQHHLI
jgi:hypothetical protein